jgi:nitrogen regulatory protein PII
MKLVRALVDHEDLEELRAAIVEAGAVQIVLSEASLYTSAPRTEVFRGQRRKVAFDPRLRLEVTVPESDVQRVVQAIQQIPGISPYPQVIDATLATAVGDSDGGRGAGEHAQGDPPMSAGAPARPGPRSTAGRD